MRHPPLQILFDDRLFFQIAAALIPTLLFGSHISGVLRPSKSKDDGGLLPPIRSARGFVLIAVPVGFALLAEIFAIHLATAPSAPRLGITDAFEVATVVTVVTALTALAGVALLRPWLADLYTPHKNRVAAAVVIGASLLCLAAGFLLTDSIADARDRLADQRVACVETASDSLIRASLAATFGAQEAVGARQADILRLKEERVRLRQERGLSSSERRACREALEEQIKHANVRAKEAGERYRLSVVESALDQTAYRIAREARGRGRSEIIERFTRAFGC